MNENTGANGEPVYRAPAVGTVPIPVYRDLLRERDALRAALTKLLAAHDKRHTWFSEELWDEARALLKGSH